MKVLAGLLAGALVLGGALAGVAAYQGSRQGFLDRKGRLVDARVVGEGQDAISSISQLTLRSSSGLEVHALLRVPRAAPPYAGAVLIGGIKRGKRVATVTGLDGIARHTVLVSPDYTLDQHRRAWEGLNFFRTLLRVRPSAFEAVAGVLLLLDYLETRPDVARGRVFLVGSSLGAPAVTIAGALDGRAAAVIALYGGGRLATLVTHTLQLDDRTPRPYWLAAIMGQGLAWLLAPLEPVRYAPGIAPRPFLMVNGSSDSLVPRANVLALYEAAHPPKELIWVASEHVQPTEAALIGELAGIVTSWLERQGLLPKGES